MQATIKRINASLAEVRERERALNDGGFRACVREETLAWLRSHSEEAKAITVPLTSAVAA